MVLSTKVYFSEKATDTNVKVFNMITNKNEAKTMTKYVSCDCSATCNSNQKWNNKTCECEN